MKADQTAVLNRTAAKKAEALQGEIQRWKAAVGDHLTKLSGGRTTGPCTAVLHQFKMKQIYRGRASGP